MHGLEHEVALLGGLMDQPERLDGLTGLEPHHFALPEHGDLFDAIRREIRKGRTANALTLRGKVHGIDDDLLLHLTECAAFGPEIGDYARMVSDRAVRRRVAEVCHEACSRTETGGEGNEADAILQGLSDALDGIRDDVAWDEPVLDSMCALELINSPGRASDRVCKTGIACLDNMIGGLPRGEVSVIAARPAMGKTALSVVMAINAILAGESAGIIGLEMSASVIGMRAATYGLWTTGRRAEPVSSVFNDRPLPNGYREALGDVLVNGIGKRLMLTERGAMTTNDIDMQIRAWKRHARAKGLPPVGVVFIDHIGHVRHSQPARSLYEKTSYVSNELLAVAKRHPDVAFVNLVQLRRLDKHGDKRPGLDDLRDSGKIEEDARLVMLLHRQDYYLGLQAEDEDASEQDRVAAEQKLIKVKGKAEIIVAKNTHGATGVSHIRHAIGQGVFRDPAWRPWEKQ